MLGVFAADEPELVDCRQPYSFFFDLIGRIWRGTRPPGPFHRICSLMRKMGVQAFLAETLAPFPELASQQQAAAIRCHGNVTSDAIRLTFSRSVPQSLRWQDIDDNDVLGYAVVVRMDLPDKTTRCFVLESVVREPSIWLEDAAGNAGPRAVANNYTHCCKEFTTTIGTRECNRDVHIRGSFFCQQDDLTHVCAHAALRMVINSSTSYQGRKLTNEMINAVLGIDHQDRNSLGHFSGDGPDLGAAVGLETSQILQVVQELGLSCHVADFTDRPGIDYADYIYPLIESGFPTILGIANPVLGHVLAVLGHTSDFDRWTPEAGWGYGRVPASPYLPSSGWVDHFIVSDDNFGMYVTVPTEAIRNILVPKFNPNLHAAIAIGIVPSEIRIPGYLVETGIAHLITRLVRDTPDAPDRRWFGPLRSYPLVCRTLVSDKPSYVNSLVGFCDDGGRTLTEVQGAWLTAALPDRFWVTELTIPHLFAGNKHKLGDVITRIDATPQKHIRNESMVFAWLPGLAWSGPGLSQGPFIWPITGHVPLLRGKGIEHRQLEW